MKIQGTLTVISCVFLTACGLNDVDRTFRPANTDPFAQQDDPGTNQVDLESYIISLQGPQNPIAASGTALECKVQLDSEQNFSLVILKFVSLNPVTDEIYETLAESILDYPNTKAASYIATASDIGKDIGCLLEFKTSDDLTHQSLADTFSSIEASTDYDLLVQSLEISSTKPKVGGNLSCTLTISNIFSLEDIESIELFMVHIKMKSDLPVISRVLAFREFSYDQKDLNDNNRILSFTTQPTQAYTKDKVYCYAEINHRKLTAPIKSFSNEAIEIFPAKSCLLKPFHQLGNSSYSRVSTPQESKPKLVNIEKVKLSTCALQYHPATP